MVATRLITSSTSLYDGSLIPGNIVIGGAGSDQIKDSGLTPFKTFISTADPTSAADISQGYSAGSFGINTGTGRSFACRSNALGAAVWEPLTPTSYRAGNWFVPSGVDGLATSTIIASTTTMTLVPIRLDERVTLSTLATKINTAGSSNSQLGIYAADPTDRLPTGLPLAHTGDIANNVTGPVSGVITTGGGTAQFDIGRYWFAVTQNDATVIYIGPSATTPWFNREIGSTSLANLTGGIGSNVTGSIQVATAAYNTWGDLTTSGRAPTFNTNGSKGALPFLLPSSVP